MTTRTHKRISVLLIAALLLAAALPAVAQEARGSDSTGGEIRLHLAEALSFEPIPGLDSLPGETGTAESVTPPRAPLSDLGQTTAWGSWRALQQAEAMEEEAAPKKRGAGRWLKKHWYVPVLAAAAVGALTIDSGDDDSSGEDD